MLRYLLILMFLAAPTGMHAAPAPSDCDDHFLGGEMPDIGRERAGKSRFVCFSQYALLHSALTKTPVWSAEHLTSDRVQEAAALSGKRPNNFHAESRVPADERAELSDYKASGFDRGHMSPNGDMSTREAQRESFSLANMVPQNACNNEEIWEGIESAVRQLALDEEEVFVVTGPIYPKDAQLQQIGEGVIVPTALFKAVYIPSRNQGAAYVTKNEDTKEGEFLSFAELKSRASLDPFPSLKDSVKTVVADLPSPQPPKFKCRLH
jgi:endonuclease G, mitochondrial